MISRELEATLGLAVAEARRRRHEYLTLEHVLYALLHDSAAAEVIHHCGGDVPGLKRELETYFEDGLEKRTLAGSVRLAWKELATVEPRSGAITVRARGGQILSIATARFAPEDRNRLERTIARRVIEASRASGP